MYINLFLSLPMQTLSHKFITNFRAGFFSAAAATIVKIYCFKGLSDHADITLSWSPITLWYT